MQIVPASSQDFSALLTLWENSVKATHTFLTSDVIDALRHAILHEYFPQLTLYQLIIETTPHGFIGVQDNRIEMLFVAPESQHQGIGKKLLQFAIQHCHATELDVNEQNTQATLFYQRMGFKQYARSKTDAQGRPYPLLHMRYQP